MHSRLRSTTTTRLLAALASGVLLLGVAACGSDDDQAADEPTSAESAAEPEGADEAEAAPEPAIDDLPDVVAEVNGQDITRDEFVDVYTTQFSQLVAQAQMSGEEIDQDELKQRTADNMVSRVLLTQEAESRDLTATDEQVDQTLSDLAEQNGIGSVEEFIEALGQQGLDPEQVRTEVGLQVQLDQLLAEEAGDLEPTRREVRDYYDEIVASQGEAGEAAGEEGGIPPLADVREEIVAQLRTQKESEALDGLLASLREGAEITVNL